MRSRVTPRAARNTGTSPHTIPSFRLLIMPAWLAANSARSRQLVRSRMRANPGRDCAEQHVGEHDPTPTRRPDDEQRHREPREPACDEQRLAADPIGELSGEQVGERFDDAKADKEGKDDGLRDEPEVRLGDEWDDGAL